MRGEGRGWQRGLSDFPYQLRGFCPLVPGTDISLCSPSSSHKCLPWSLSESVAWRKVGTNIAKNHASDRTRSSLSMQWHGPCVYAVRTITNIVASMLTSLWFNRENRIGSLSLSLPHWGSVPSIYVLYIAGIWLRRPWSTRAAVIRRCFLVIVGTGRVDL